MEYDNKILEKLLVDFIYNETTRIGVKKGIIGLSGGIDSAVSAFLAAKALCKENMLFVLMPYKKSSKSSITDAIEVAEQLKVRYEIIEITDMVDTYLRKYSDEEISNVRKGNIMARMRMITLYDLSARESALVIGTGNKTEIMLGYTTLFGDSACAINPIGDLYKTQVRMRAKHLNVPECIIEKKPSADLWEGQTDEEEMGITYDYVDKYLFQKIDEKKSDKELSELGFSDDFIQKIDSMIMRNQFKRVPPIIAKVSNRTVNIDFRYNRDWNT